MAVASKAPSTKHLLTKLRALMQTSSGGQLSAYIVPAGDSHQSEYIADCDARRAFISKFNGSAGTAIITQEAAALWTDGRYFLQASQQLDPDCWTLMKDGLPGTLTQSEWLRSVLKGGSKVGVDPCLIPRESWKKLGKELKSCSIELVAVGENLIDCVWQDKETLVPGVDKPRPPQPQNKVFSLPLSITGASWQSKIAELREELEKKKATAIIITNLDDIAWLFNLRGSDIDYNPVFFSYSIVSLDKIYLFVEKSKLSDKELEILNAKNPESSINDILVTILPYESIFSHIKNELVAKEQGLIWVSERSSQAIYSSVPKSRIVSYANPIAAKKAIKNEVEIKNMKHAHVKDAAALVEYLAWLENQINTKPEKHESLFEISAADYLEECRKKQENFMGLSFPSISSSGKNGAIIHYKPDENSNSPILKNEMYLIDSGAHYLEGTTDVTRTVHFGEPSDYEKECFTRVLKGHIQLALAKFPSKFKGCSLDGFARRALWEVGLDYNHGTGHGVGMFLNVHEGPISISPRYHPDDTGLNVGNILSNEPGYYEDGKFGIRIENLIVVKEAELRYNFQNRGFLEFETITLVPIQLKLIKTDMLSKDEIKWLNEYHKVCRERVGAYLDKLGKKAARVWLDKETVEISA